MNGGTPSWFPRRRPTSEGVALICFPPAGGTGSTFAQWKIPGLDIVPVRFPGRSVRRQEAPIEDLERLVAEFGEEIGPTLSNRYYMLGVCLGGIVAYECARWLMNRGFPTPTRLFVSGCGAPSTPFLTSSTDELTDAALVDQLRRWGGTDDEVLANPEMLAMMLPPVRTDLRMLARYVHSSSPPVRSPITAFRGKADHEVEPSAVEDWARCTSGEFRSIELEGGHFVSTAPLLQAILEETRRDRA